MAATAAAPFWPTQRPREPSVNLQEGTRSCERPPADSSPPPPPAPCSAAPTLLEATLIDVAATLAGGAPLPRHTSTLLRSLFPSCAALCAATTSPDGLGTSVLTLLAPTEASENQLERGAGAGELAAALPRGQRLCFSLAAAPSAVEASLMQAFADALADALRPAAVLLTREASLPPEPRTPPPESPPNSRQLPADLFWESL